DVNVSEHTPTPTTNGQAHESPRFASPLPRAASALTRFPARGLSHLPTQSLQACPSSRQVQTLKPGKILLAGLELGGDPTDFVDASSAHDVDSARDLLELNLLVALHERHLFGAFLEDLLDARTQLIPVSVLIVDLELVVFEHLDDNGFVLQFLILLLILVGLRNERVQALGNQRSDDH